MRPGKHICETLKGIRLDIARANDIEYHPTKCDHKGDCAGTCPACESEVRWLEKQLRLRQQCRALRLPARRGETEGFYAAGRARAFVAVRTKL